MSITTIEGDSNRMKVEVVSDSISQICYRGKISLPSDAVNSSFYDNLTSSEVNLFVTDATFFLF